MLAEIKSDDKLFQIPVVVLTTSQSEEDILRSYQLHANAYVTKPVDFDRFIEVVRQIDDFFLTVVFDVIGQTGGTIEYGPLFSQLATWQAPA